MRMLIELATVSMQRTKNANSRPWRLACLSMARVAQRKSWLSKHQLLLKKRPKQVRHSEGNMLPFAIRQNMALLGNPLFGAFEATRTAGFGFTGLTKEA
ncbi:hypothetical protein ArsFIN_17420 [Arsenophonus nasoniae]|uniref:Uncharacterized protein n=1 Tax=Arsenophonus nasoniae TaxID=638 RepID=A0A4P7KSS8_9GAMM|nr:hypothetical protein ArsFIN_17420 [Arsenophonus nasoniae]